MFGSAIFHGPGDGTAEEKLWRAVIARTLEEWVRGPLRRSRKAEEFLFNDNRDFPAVCSSAGMDARTLRRRLISIRARGLKMEDLPFRSRKHKQSDSRAQAMFGEKAYGV
jgi:hypothetical protein